MFANKCLSRVGVLLMLAFVAFTAGCANNQGRWVALETEEIYLEKALLDGNDVPSELIADEGSLNVADDHDFGVEDDETMEHVGGHECSSALWGLNTDVIAIQEPNEVNGRSFESDESRLVQMLATFSDKRAAEEVTADLIALPTDCHSWNDTLYGTELQYKHKILEHGLVGDQIYATRTYLIGASAPIVLDRVILRADTKVCLLQIMNLGGRSDDVENIVTEAYEELRNPDYPLFTFPRDTDSSGKDEVEA